MPKVELSVLVDDAHLADILEVSQRLQSEGFQVEKVMDIVGIITGSCDEEKVDSLSQIEGVSQVAPQQTYQLAPPDSEIQ